MPIIQGSTYGIENYGTLNFYDGVIKGTTQAIYGSVASTPEFYETSYLENGTKAILEIISVVDKVATVNGINYTTIEAAINSAINTSGTVILHKDIELTSPITIEEGQSLTIDLNAYSITYSSEDTAIINNGTLTIVDSAEAQEGEEVISTIENTVGATMQNNGNLILGTNDETRNEMSPVIKGTILGEGTVTIYDGLVDNS